MPFALKTLTDCIQSLSDRHDKGVVPADSSTLSFYTRQLNNAVNYCIDKLRLTKTVTLTTVNGTVDLPDDFIARDTVFLGKLEYIQTEPNGVGSSYWITGNQFDGWVLNVPEDNTYTVTYSFRPAEMVNGTDVCVIPDIEAPVSRAYAVIRKGESDPFEDADAALIECDRRLKEVQSSFDINSNSIGFDWV